MSDLLEKRELFMRAEVTEDGQLVRGVGVPYGETITVWGQRERLEAGAVEAEGALLFYRHTEPIGVVVEHRDDTTGWYPTARFSNTRAAQDARELARDGALPGMSIGFEPIEWRNERDDDGDVIVYTRVRVREVSLVPFPAYPSAHVTEVREDTNHKESKPMTDPQEREGALDEIREDLDLVKRSLTVLTDRTGDPAPQVDRRSAGQILKAIVAGDEATVRQYNDLVERAYEGGVAADTATRPGWVGDLTRIFDSSTGVLAGSFSTGTLPAEGMSIEYAQLKTNTIAVNEQAAEGDDIVMGKVVIETKSAPVKTYAGGTELSRQEIERSAINVVNTSLNALAIAAGARKKAVLRAAFADLVTARRAIAADAGVVGLGATLAAATADNWEDALVDAALKYEELNLPLERLLVSATVFKRLRRLTVAGERVFRTGEKNSSGVLDLPGLRGDFAGIPVLLDSGQAGDSAVFTNSLAIRQYDSALVTLADEKISNLTKQFAVYRYGAVAPEIPAGIVPVKFGA